MGPRDSAARHELFIGAVAAVGPSAHVIRRQPVYTLYICIQRTYDRVCERTNNQHILLSFLISSLELPAPNNPTLCSISTNRPRFFRNVPLKSCKLTTDYPHIPISSSNCLARSCMEINTRKLSNGSK